MLCKFPSAVCLLLLSTTNWTTARCGKHHPHNSRAKRVSDAHVFQEYMAHHTSTPTGSLLLPPPLPLNQRSGKESRLKYIICTGSVKVTTTLIPYTYLICVKIIKISIIKFLSRYKNEFQITKVWNSFSVGTVHRYFPCSNSILACHLASFH